jgi:4-hydroxy-tetrahydrodipicolinate synthase
MLAHNHQPPHFSGLWIPLITPFRDGVVDHESLSALVKRYAKDGASGFVACGSTGEAAALDATEQLAVLQTVLQACGNLPVVMGVSGYNLPKMLAWVKALASYPIAGLLVPAPSYIRPSQAGLEAWFTAIAEATQTPLIVYDIPYRTGVVIELATLMRLANHPRIVAIKDCGGDAAKTRALIADGRLAVLAGDDIQLFTTVAQGGAGAIAASAHVHTAAFVDVIRHLRNGELAQARRAWEPLPAVIEAMFAEPNPASIKAALAAQGLIQNELRLPMMATQISSP